MKIKNGCRKVKKIPGYFQVFQSCENPDNYAIKLGTLTMTNTRNKEMWWAYIQNFMV